MSYLLIYHDNLSTLVMGEYETREEALEAMRECRKWYEHHLGPDAVRFEIRDVSYD